MAPCAHQAVMDDSAWLSSTAVSAAVRVAVLPVCTHVAFAMDSRRSGWRMVTMEDDVWGVRVEISKRVGRSMLSCSAFS